MFVLANLLSSLAQILAIVLNAYSWIVIIRALVSWVNPDPLNPIVQFLQTVTEPLLSPIRRILPPVSRFGIDISPVILLLILAFLRSFLVGTLLELSFRFHSA